ncbi:tRNA (N(6)-L-threonylcarbamoyladenosine(37)-C(2))-methylthiotransferase MtaB [Heliophilum fasciatum]|uniref:Threonylcarbamoyladenosine tRNA methylthiotransferase MtaB n=1 Tax=Heliophilum fasciatum TaxID=35700 RepID=A0A4R2RMG8_9FIRM|nr:tRNA (N(6)-L-threonylcarbamoyladenosine(37)-C(2))-methylthiotransferase MtaB [Heliophilum fasciatum]MCW2278134.1 threonylcarbamoyladenosine tRNA methylthiotransferase MtaB [Heliophilum fasciatum]TCP64204.1 threonylcarbamoyladenosine tRNA methylthiotransferase MtaB [Heliophilum fasciatum]
MTDRQRTVAFYTLGCKVNQGESAAMAGMFTARGYRLVPFEEMADVYVINTCTVTHLSDRKSRQMIRRAHRHAPEAVIAVVGCYAQSSPEAVEALEGVQVVVGTEHRSQLVDLVEAAAQAQQGTTRSIVGDVRQQREFEEFPAVAETARTRATIKIQDGCDLFCTYCIIPHVRGPVRSRHRERVLAEAARLINEGFQEIVLSGIHLGAYGTDHGTDLASLIRELCALPGLPRLRIGSVEPQEFTPELLAAIEAPQVCPHFHIPLQSGADPVLKRMGRRYRQRDFADVLAKVRKHKPGAAITSDVLTGFPGETEADAEATLAFCRDMAFAALHVFPFSPRQGTPAATFADPVPPAVKEARAAELGRLARELSTAYAESWLGRTVTVLLEEPVDAGWTGHSENYLTVHVPLPATDAGNRPTDTAELQGKPVTVQLDKLLPNGQLQGRWVP